MAGVDNPVRAKARDEPRTASTQCHRRDRGAARACREALLARRELAPGTSRVAVLLDPADPATGALLIDMRTAAKSVGLTLNAVEVAGYMDVEPAIVAIKRQGSKFLVVAPSAMLVPRWIADLALTHGLACLSTSPAYVSEGGLLACTDDATAVFGAVANFVVRILNGAKPADLPVELPPKFRLVVNRKTARALKLTLPPSILQGADAIID
jgi:putative ABC transport system substrate-binding protein